MRSTHETIFDDTLIELHFASVTASDQLLAAHWHEHLELLAITEGTMTAYINETSYLLKKGDILVVNARDIHYTHAHKDCCYLLLQIPPVHLERVSEEWNNLQFAEYLEHQGDTKSLNCRMTELLQTMNRLYYENKAGNHLLFLGKLYELLHLLLTEGCREVNLQRLGKARRDFHRIEQSMDYVREHFSEEITLSEIAELLSVTPEHFCRLFKKCTGQTFFTYVNQIRLMQFYRDLTRTEESITYLLDKNGIRNYKVFLRMFKESYGTTPQKVRKNLEEAKENPEERIREKN